MNTQNKSLAHALLTETVSHYNSNNRSHSKGPGCVYAMEERRCAIGRILTEEGIQNILRSGMNVGKNVNHVLAIFTSSILQEKWRPIAEDLNGIHFLGRLQSLHDEVENWNEYGISKAGTLHALSIANDIWEPEKIRQEVSA